MLEALKQESPLKTEVSEAKFNSGTTLKDRKNDYYHHLKKMATNAHIDMTGLNINLSKN